MPAPQYPPAYGQPYPQPYPQPSSQPYPQQWPGQHSNAQYPPGQQPRVDGFAITSFVTGLIGGVLFSIGFGIASLVRIRRGTRRGRGFAIAGLTLSLVWIVVAVAVIAYRAGRAPERNSDNAITHQGHFSPTELRTGDCVRMPPLTATTVTSVWVVPCGQLHNAQVFTLLQSTETTYRDDIDQVGLKDCQDAMPAFLGTADTPLHVLVFVPLKDAWNRGDRTERCLLVDRRKDITGDIRSDH